MADNNKLFIPEKIKVGFQKREGTYTGKLAYVIYFDKKGVLRKEKSWNSWRDNKIAAQELENIPTEGFVLNKGVGGARDSWSSWNTRNEYIRVYDPRDFEFEISVSNLLFLLQECSSIKGKGLEGKFVYSWNGTELVLLPAECKEFAESQKYTSLQGKKIKAKDVEEGCLYYHRDGTQLMYLGKHYANSSENGWYPIGQKHVFFKMNLPPNSKDRWGSKICQYLFETNFSKIAERSSETFDSGFADRHEEFIKSKYFGELKGLEIKKIGLHKLNEYGQGAFFIKSGNNYINISVSKYNVYNAYYEKEKTISYRICKSEPFIPQIKNNIVNINHTHFSSKESFLSEEEFQQLEPYALYVITTHGTKIRII